MILVVNDYDRLYGKFWSNLGEITRDSSILFTDPDRIDLVCFTGGEDVSPELYGHKNLASGNSKERDETEALIFEMARKHEIAMTGICRGAQFLNAMCGGTMVQHLKASHGGGHHRCQTYDGREFQVTSSHHQMIVPGEGCEVLGWAAIRLNPGNCVYDGKLPASVLEGDEFGPIVRVTEAIAYPKLRIFGVQHHPEWQRIEEEGPQWTLAKTRELCLGENQTLVIS